MKLHRRIREWDWYRAPKTLAVFLELLLRAGYVARRYQGEEIGRGEVLTTYEELGVNCGLSRDEMRTALKNLRASGTVHTRRCKNRLLVRLAIYEVYQGRGGVGRGAGAAGLVGAQEPGRGLGAADLDTVGLNGMEANGEGVAALALEAAGLGGAQEPGRGLGAAGLGRCGANGSPGGQPAANERQAACFAGPTGGAGPAVPGGGPAVCPADALPHYREEGKEGQEAAEAKKPAAAAGVDACTEAKDGEEPGANGRAEEVCRRFVALGFGPAGGYVRREVARWLELGLEPALLCAALEEAARCGMRFWGYVDSILQRCHRQGLRTGSGFLQDKGRVLCGPVRSPTELDPLDDPQWLERHNAALKRQAAGKAAVAPGEAEAGA